MLHIRKKMEICKIPGRKREEIKKEETVQCQIREGSGRLSFDVNALMSYSETLVET